MSDSSVVIENKLASESIGKLIWSYSLPAIVGTVVMSLYNIVDRVFIGQGVGAFAISGLALTLPFMNILTAFGMLVGSGAASRISIALGREDKERAEKILANAFILSFIITGIGSTLAYVFMGDLLRFFGGTESTLKYAEEYIRIIIPGAILATLNYSFNNVMRACGYPRKAMYTMVICALTNVVLDYIFIFVFEMGIRGAAYATNISFFVGTVWVLFHFIQRNTIIQFRRKNFVLDKAIIKSILSIGMSPFSIQIVMSFVVVIMNLQLIKYGGDLAIGAYGILNSIAILIIMIIIGLTQGIQPILGFNYGAQLYDRMFKVLWVAVVISTCISTIGFLLGMFVPRLMVGVFTTHEELISISANALKISMIFFPVVGFQIVVSNFFQSIGKAKISIFLSLTRQVIFLIPCLLVLPFFGQLNGVWAALPLSDFLSMIVTAITIFIFIKKFQKSNQF